MPHSSGQMVRVGLESRFTRTSFLVKAYSLPMLVVLSLTIQSLNRYRRIPCIIAAWKNKEWGRVLLSIFREKRHYKHP